MLKLVCILFCACTLALQVYADSLPFDLRLGASCSSNGVQTKISVINRSAGCLNNLWAEARLDGRTNQVDSIKILPSGSQWSAAIDLGPAPASPGLRTILFELAWTDDTGRPHEVFRTISLTTGDIDPTASPLSVSGAMRTAGKVSAIVRTSKGPLTNVAVRLQLPQGLSTQDSVIWIPTLNTGDEHFVRFAISDPLSPPDTVHPVSVIADAESDGSRWTGSWIGSIGTITPLSDKFPWRAALIVIAIVAVTVRSALSGRKTGDAGATRQARLQTVTDAAVLAGITVFLFTILPLNYILKDTTVVGGDTPAHNYMVSHLRNQLLSGNGILSWASGWWAGFPMFQFYFPFPYIITALLSMVLPFNIAFKLISIAGMIGLPFAAYACARMMRMPAPGPAVMSLFSLLFLFDASNTMWGVNIYSTLAGMIANSMSFDIMLIVLGLTFQDSDRGKIRIITVLTITALVLSHFFTSIVAAATIAIFPFLKPGAGFKRALKVLLVEALLAFLLSAWWLLPLVAKRDFTAAFGTNWNVNFISTIWEGSRLIIPASLAALALGITLRARFVAIFCWMFALASALFVYGQSVSEVFVNVRLWPFILFALSALAAAGIGLASDKYMRHLPFAGVAAALILVALCLPYPLDARTWAKWNYSGLEENESGREVFKQLVMPLKGTPGRLAYDLHPDNERLGSSRVFECVPHLTGKPILEGGLVSGAWSSAFAYYIQSETSREPAGQPNMVRPSTFNMTNALEHLKLFDVRHFIARSAETKHALSQSPQWKLVRQYRGWNLYEREPDDSQLVYVPARDPLAVRTRNWQSQSLEWIYDIRNISQPYVFLSPSDTTDRRFTAPLGDDEFTAALRLADTSGVQRAAGTVQITRTLVSDSSIQFTTTGVGLPHIIKCSYYPNWKVRGADRIYMVTPCFMMVYPTQPDVELYYGYTPTDIAGWILTGLGGTMLIGLAFFRHYAGFRGNRRFENSIA